MARLTQQDKAATRERILLYLESIGNATEAELSEALGIDRRTVNNYLRCPCFWRSVEGWASVEHPGQQGYSPDRSTDSQLT